MRRKNLRLWRIKGQLQKKRQLRKSEQLQKSERLRKSRRLQKSVQLPFRQDKRTWANKFKNAFCGLLSSVKGQSSYRVHSVAAIVVLMLSFLIGNFDSVRWSLIVLCIVLVIVAEMLNTSIENLAKAITTSYDSKIALALDIASGAVLLVSFGAAIVGIILFTESILKQFTT